MKKPYVKPTVASEVVFSATSQGCDVNEYGTCQNGFKFVICPFKYKRENEFCPLPPPIPRPKS